MNSTIANLETNENLKTVLNLISQIAPGNENVAREFGKISKNKDTFIQQLQDLWNSCPFPTHTEVGIRKLCREHYSDELGNNLMDRLQGRTSRPGNNCPQTKILSTVKTAGLGINLNPKFLVE